MQHELAPRSGRTARAPQWPRPDARRARRLAYWLALLTSVVCALAVASWLSPYGTRVPDTDQPSTALASALGFALLALLGQSYAVFPRGSRSPIWEGSRLTAAGAVLAFAAVILMRYALQLHDAGSPLGRDWGVTAPGTAVALLLDAAALMAIDARKHRLASWIASVCLVLCELSLVAYLLDQAAMRETVFFGYMAPMTAIVAACVAAIVLCLAKDRNWLTEIIDGGPAGVLRGRLVASAILLPVLVQAIIAWMVEVYGIPTAVGRALVAMIVGLILAREILHTSKLHRQSQELSARLVAIVESSDDAIIGKDLDGKIVSWNAGAERLFGYSEPEILGKTMTLLIPKDRPEEEAAILSNIRLGRRLRSYETRRIRSDGEELDVSVTASPIHAADGTIAGVSSITRDISDLVRINEQLRNSNAELEQFAYIASHDMREPLRMVANYVELLEEHLEGQLDDTGQRYLHHVSQGAMRMQQMIADLLTYARVEPQGRPLVPTPLEPVLALTTAMFAEDLTACDAKLECGPMPSVLGNDVQLGQVFQNVVGNAIKFRSSNRPLRIRIEASRDGDTWTIKIADNGIGFEPDHAERIFAMFQRLNPRGEYPGSGIGLAIVRRIVERHGGSVWVSSAPDRGTEVFFTLKGI